MITLGDKVRAAAEATAREVTPDSIPDWQDFAIGVASGQEPGSRTSRGRVRSRWFAPALAAAAVLAVVAVSVAVAAGQAARHPGPQAPDARPGQFPAYFAAVSVEGSCPLCLVIRSARTGAILAEARPPRHSSYSAVSSAADDTTFVAELATIPSAANGFKLGYSYLMARFNPARRTITIRKLPITPLRGLGVPGSAVSPDGRELAVTLLTDHRELRVYSLATGAFKDWTSPGVVDQTGLQQGLAWGPGGLLAFDWRGPHTSASAPSQIRLLNTSAPGGNLLTESRLAVPEAQPGGYTLQGQFALIDNGHEVVTVLQGHDAPAVTKYAVLSTDTGHLIRSFLPSRSPHQGVVWANPSGTVIAGYLPGTGPSGQGVLEWITGSTHTPIKGIPSGPVSPAF
jgi:hypothetical protein